MPPAPAADPSDWLPGATEPKSPLRCGGARPGCPGAWRTRRLGTGPSPALGSGRVWWERHSPASLIMGNALQSGSSEAVVGSNVGFQPGSELQVPVTGAERRRRANLHHKGNKRTPLSTQQPPILAPDQARKHRRCCLHGMIPAQRKQVGATRSASRWVRLGGAPTFSEMRIELFGRLKGGSPKMIVKSILRFNLMPKWTNLGGRWSHSKLAFYNIFNLRSLQNQKPFERTSKVRKWTPKRQPGAPSSPHSAPLVFRRRIPPARMEKTLHQRRSSEGSLLQRSGGGAGRHCLIHLVQVLNGALCIMMMKPWPTRPLSLSRAPRSCWG